MRLSTIILSNLVLQENGIRAAARYSGAPPSTVTVALQRLEAELAIPLLRRSHGGLAFSVQAEQTRASLMRLGALCATVYGLSADDGAIRLSLDHPVTLQALFRLGEVLRAGSIRKAALRMNVGQPQLTRDISKLEERLRRKLLLRGSHGVTPTEDGIALLDVIDELHEIWGISTTADNRFMRTLRGKSFGSVIPLGAQSEVSEIVARVSLRWLHRHKSPLFVASATAEELLTGLDDGRYDAVLLDSVPNEGAIG